MQEPFYNRKGLSSWEDSSYTNIGVDSGTCEVSWESLGPRPLGDFTLDLQERENHYSMNLCVCVTVKKIRLKNS